MEAWRLALAFGGSLVAGYLGAAVGLVLGTLRLPLILLLTGDPSSGAGTNIGISAASAASGGVAHVRAGRVSWQIVRWMTPPSVAGAVVGGLFGHHVPEDFLLGGVAAVLAWNGFDLVARPTRGRPRQQLRLAPTVVFGFLIGLVGGAVGVILGTLRMPVLLGAVGLTAGQAVGTNLVVGFAVGLFGLVAHATRLQVEWVMLGVGVAGALLGAWFGARVTGRLTETTLRRAIGTALLVIAVAFVVGIALG